MSIITPDKASLFLQNKSLSSKHPKTFNHFQSHTCYRKTAIITTTLAVIALAITLGLGLGIYFGNFNSLTAYAETFSIAFFFSTATVASIGLLISAVVSSVKARSNLHKFKEAVDKIDIIEFIFALIKKEQKVQLSPPISEMPKTDLTQSKVTTKRTDQEHRSLLKELSVYLNSEVISISNEDKLVLIPLLQYLLIQMSQESDIDEDIFCSLDNKFKQLTDKPRSPNEQFKAFDEFLKNKRTKDV